MKIEQAKRLKELERENVRLKKLVLVHRCAAIIASSLDIQQVFDDFVGELGAAVDVDWAAVIMAENEDLRVVALSTTPGSKVKTGDRVPIEGVATEWLAAHGETLLIDDLSQVPQATVPEVGFYKGTRAVARLPLAVGGRAIGSLVVASNRPGAYSRSQVALLEQVAAQISVPVENSQYFADIRKKARTDDLTGLLNRRSLDDAMAAEVSRHSRYGGAFSLVILDLDSFKAYNDSYGHLFGDKLLGRIGNALNRSTRGADQCFRYGGDEFAVLLPMTSIDTATSVVERIRKEVSAITVSDQVRVTASLGLASWPASGKEPDEVIAAADAALYEAKQSGGDQSRRAPSE